MSESEAFAARLRANGEDEATVTAYLRIAERITSVAGGWRVSPKHVDEAMRRAEQSGASVQQVANVKRVGDALVAFSRTSLPPEVSGSLPLSTPHEGRCRHCGGLLSITMPESSGGAATWAGGASAAASFFAVRLFGCFGVIAILCAGACVVALYRGFMTRPKCTMCGQLADRGDLDRELQGDLDGARRKAFLGAAGFGLASAVTFVVWIGLAITALQLQQGP